MAYVHPDHYAIGLEPFLGPDHIQGPPVVLPKPYPWAMGIGKTLPPHLTAFSVRIECPACHNPVNSMVDYEAGNMAWLVALVLLIVFFPLVWVPLVWGACKDAHHKCPYCGTLLGVYRRCCSDYTRYWQHPQY